MATPKNPIALLLSVAEMAKLMKLTKATAHRRLEALWAQDVAEGKAHWRMLKGKRKDRVINLSALLKAHPELKEVRYVSRSEIAATANRLTNVELDIRRVKSRVATLERASVRP